MLEEASGETGPDDVFRRNRYSAHPIGRLKNTLVAILRLLAAATVLALIVLLVEVVAGVLLVRAQVLLG